MNQCKDFTALQEHEGGKASENASAFAGIRRQWSGLSVLLLICCTQTHQFHFVESATASQDHNEAVSSAGPVGAF